MKEKILRVLRGSGDYVSGQELCEQMGVSRTAVWKVIGQLKDEGYEIEAVRNRGYRIKSVPDSLEASEVKSRLHTHLIGQEVYFSKEIDSTNTWLRRLEGEGCREGAVTLADTQTKGKGRRGRVWQTPEGTSIPVSILLKPDFPPEKASMLTLVMGLSVAQAIKSVCGLQTGIKWPNDVVVSGKKICGILTEMNAQMDYIEYVIVGVGINANMTEFSEELADKATSLRNELGHPVNRADIVAAVLEAFEKNYDYFLETLDLSGMQEEYNRILLNKDEQVRVLQPGAEYKGMALGIDEKGNLLVQREDDGRIEQVYAGEVSVRGLYSYV